MFLRLFALMNLIMSVALNACETSYAQHQKPTEYEVKAAYIYNFAKFVEWPARPSWDANATMTVCLFGEDPFGPALSAIEGKTVGDKKIIIKRNSLSQNLGDCDILFISNSEKEELARILEAIGDLSVLTIGDTEGFAQQGVMINFYIEEKRVRFEINPKAAARAGLKISANLLRIAKIVGEP